MTDLHFDDGTVQSAGIVGGTLVSVGLLLWGITGGAVIREFRRIKKELADMRRHCSACPAVRAMEDAAIRNELNGKIDDVAERIERRMDKQDTDMHARLDSMTGKIISALGVRAARGEAD